MTIEFILFLLLLFVIWTIQSKRTISADGHIEDPIKDHVFNIHSMIFEYIYLLIDFIKKLGITILSI